MEGIQEKVSYSYWKREEVKRTAQLKVQVQELPSEEIQVRVKGKGRCCFIKRVTYIKARM